jgi:hypothetical protein
MSQAPHLVVSQLFLKELQIPAAFPHLAVET